MNYSDQLKDSRWKKLREAILQRDNFTCTKCSNRKLLAESQKFTILERKELRLHQIAQGWDKAMIEVKLGKDNYDNSSLEYTGYIEFIEANDYVEKDDKVYLDFSIEENPEIVCIKDKSGKTVKAIKGLHVHHKYYQVDKLAWEYDDSALICLCWFCHEKEHKDMSIKVYDRDMKHIDNYKYCTRCYGAGWFPEYTHVQKGICFRCNGARYEQVICK